MIVRNKQIKQKTQEEINKQTRSNTSTAMNKGVEMSYKTVTTQVLTVKKKIGKLIINIRNQRVILRHIIPVFKFPLQ